MRRVAVVLAGIIFAAALVIGIAADGVSRTAGNTAVAKAAGTADETITRLPTTACGPSAPLDTSQVTPALTAAQWCAAPHPTVMATQLIGPAIYRIVPSSSSFALITTYQAAGTGEFITVRTTLPPIGGAARPSDDAQQLVSGPARATPVTLTSGRFVALLHVAGLSEYQWSESGYVVDVEGSTGVPDLDVRKVVDSFT